MFCPSCGAALLVGAKFCTQCAQAVKACAECGYANPSAAKFCAGCGRALAADPAAPAASTPQRTPAPPAERRHLTVMFCDLVGSTALTAGHDPEDVREAIGTFQRCISDHATSFGGYVAQHFGDGALIYFGYPQAHENDAERAIRAGLAIVDAVSALRLLAGHRPRIRVGIATGVVVVGDIPGTPHVGPERTIIGETPNLAARLQAVAEPDTVVIAASTRRLVGDLFECEDLGSFELKGFAAPMPVWRVLRESAISSRFDALRTASLTPLIGREAQIALLQDRWALAKSGRGQVVLVSGEPGIGKSRIAVTLRKSLEQEPLVRMLWFCSPYHQNTAFYPVIRQLEYAAGFARDDSAERKLGKLRSLLARGNSSPDDVALIADLLSLPSGLDQAGRLDPQRQKQKTMDALHAQMKGLAAGQPLLVMMEDAHWIDPTTDDLLAQAVDRVAELPALLVVTARPEFTPAWTTKPHVTTMSVGRLEQAQIEAMVSAVTGGKSLPSEVLRQITSRADGIPLFVEEITKAVLEGGSLQEDAGRYVLRQSLAALTVPATLQDSLTARLDRLASVKEIAQISAVIGREFKFEVLAAISPFSESQLVAALDQLVASELVFSRGAPPDVTYTFKHALVQDAAYQGMLRTKRQELHLRIAEVLQQRVPEVVETQPELLAHHYASGGRDEQAAHWFIVAGNVAARRYAHAEARRQYEKALDALSRAPDSTPNRRMRIDATLQYSAVSFAASNPEENLSRLVDAERLGQELMASGDRTAEDSLRLARLQFALGRTYHYLNRPGTGITFYERALRAAEAANDEDLQGISSGMIGRALAIQGRFGRAAAALSRALALLERRQNWSEYIWARGFLALTLAARGQYEAAVAEAKRAQQVAIDIKYSTGIAAGHILLWGVYLLGREAQRMREESRVIVSVAEKAGDEMYVYLGYGMLAWAELLCGEIGQAVSCMDRALALCTKLGGRTVLFDWFAAANAEVLLQAGEPRAAIDAAEHAVTGAEASDCIFAEGHARRTWATALIRIDPRKRAEAEEQMARSLRAFEAGEARMEAARTHLAWAAILPEGSAAAREHLSLAAREFDSFKLTPDFRTANELPSIFQSALGSSHVGNRIAGG